MSKTYPDSEYGSENNHKAMIDLYEQNYRRIFNYVLYNTGDIEVALDLTSETFLRALKALPRFEYRGEKSYTAWLYKIASREIAMHFRRLTKDNKHIATYSQETEAIKQVISQEDIEAARRELEKCEDFIILASLLKELPARYCEVLFLKYIEDKTLEEIAAMLERPIGTVKAQCYRGLKSLREKMQLLQTYEHLKERERKKEPEANGLEEEVKGIGT
ncbi:MAG: RNA polymerase sigma factor [Actinobacteria bacterium]|nr:RNA polymerase sigma factor [Actinomycetota bacterium]